MSSAYSTVRGWSSSDVKETIDTAPAHLDARNITIDFYLEEHCQRVLHEVKLTVPKGIDASKAFADDYLAAAKLVKTVILVNIKEAPMIRVLGRQTSGNVQKVLFLLEELGLKYAREDYGRQFNNTDTDAYRKLNPNMKVPTLVDGDLVIWESHTILRYLAALHQPGLFGVSPAERTYVERWMDWLLASLNTPYVAVFKDAKKPPAERGAEFPAQSADLVAQLKILDGHFAAKSWFALDRLTLADIALGPILARCLDFPVERPAFADLTRWMAAIRSRPAFAVATGAKPSALNAA